SGTGKEMAAAAVHRCSRRKDGPFVAINCNAIPENLLESELFGHEKGAFTGAHIQRKGMIETASGGTLFLDEIGELPPAIQVKLLRFLQEQRFQRVGGRQEIQIDMRLVAATNADLKQLIENGKFGEDLYFRLAVVTIRLLPLRERGEDIVFLAREFLQRYAVQSGRTKLVFAPDALRAMSRYSWPGNVRELQNRVKRGVIMASGSRLTAKDLELDQDQDVAYSATSLKQAREHVEREMIEQALKRNYDKAKLAYLNVLRLDPQNGLALERIGAMWQDDGAPLRAAGFLKRASELDPKNIQNRIRLARSYVATGHFADGTKEALKVLEQAPDNGDAIITLTEAARSKEDIEAAE